MVAGVLIDKQNRVITSEQYPGRVQIFRYFTDEEAKAELAKREGKKAGVLSAKQSDTAPAETTPK